jgi:hypothetical protein
MKKAVVGQDKKSTDDYQLKTSTLCRNGDS